jgi:limonene-1,2-epoxide hydrolase
MQEGDLTRRTLFAAGGAGALAAGALASQADAADAPSGAEAANIKVVKDFVGSWAAPDFDPDKTMPLYLAPDASVRPIDSQPFITGPAALAAAFKAYAPKGERFKAQFNSVWAKGPLVITDRVDTQVGGDKNGAHFPVVGVFLVRDGKIKEWTDYVLG